MYSIRFGLNYVNYTSLERIPKLSAGWYREYVSKNQYFGGRNRFLQHNTDDSNNESILPSASPEDFILLLLIFVGVISLLVILLHKDNKQATDRAGRSSMYIELDQSVRGDNLKGEGGLCNDTEFIIEDDECDEDDREQEVEIG